MAGVYTGLGAITALLAVATIISSTSWLILNNGRPDSPSRAQPETLPTRLDRTRIAVCLVGAARRFELTGPSILRNVLAQYPQADLFLHSPLDGDTYKFSLLKDAPRVAAVKIFQPRHIVETDAHLRLLTPKKSPKGLQGLLQYFNLVEGCLGLIQSHEVRNNFTYDWIVRTRVDGFWAGPLKPTAFEPNLYTIPEGSRHGGLNDRLGIGDRKLSTVALSRLTMLKNLAEARYNNLNSETAFMHQMNLSHILVHEHQFRFCIVSDRRYKFPLGRYDTPVASMGSHGPLSGAKCRPCQCVYAGPQANQIWARLDPNRGRVEWRNKGLGLCNATGDWEKGWEEVFDELAGAVAAKARRRVVGISVADCVHDLEELRGRTSKWEALDPGKICLIGLGPIST
ncbi:unnamed protein product [Urochloa decumbens]|uniref:DUF7796 domain-containing protein n=1 Tax=Urochloa decumbens TaxID=240449 RepID=A0ABC9BBW0_9POAL